MKLERQTKVINRLGLHARASAKLVKSAGRYTSSILIGTDSETVDGKSINKDEFVTAGGVELKEINLKTMQSKLCSGLYFAGEVMNVDGITGGFKFQNAWMSGHHAGCAIAEDF